MPQEPENILVIERQALGSEDLFQGLNFDITRYLPRLLDSRQHRFVPRPEAEQDPALKQLIPYFVICRNDRVWCYRRSGKPGEKRLADRYSLGVGGHINDRDHDGDGNIYRRAALRELNEEIVVPADARDTVAALLNDDSNPVGRVHLGVVHVLTTADAVIRPREETIREAGFKTRAELQALRPNLETWSQRVLDGLDELLAAARASRETGSTGFDWLYNGDINERDGIMNDDDQKDNVPETPDTETGTEDESEDLDIRDTDILFECPQCGKSMVIDYRGAGLTIPCTDCKHPVDVPIPKGMDLTDLDTSPAEQGVRVIHMRELLSDAQRKIYAQDNLIESLRAEIESANRRAEATEKRFQDIRWEAEVIQRAIEQMGRIINDTGSRRSTTEGNG